MFTAMAVCIKVAKASKGDLDLVTRIQDEWLLWLKRVAEESGLASLNQIVHTQSTSSIEIIEALPKHLLLFF
jgi:hypothetical protein